MFQYTHELIFNSLTMPDGSKRLVRNGGETGPLTIKRGGEYWKAFIQDQKVYKTVGNFGEYELMKIDCTKLPMVAGVYQFNMFVKLLDPHALYEFGYPNYQMFGRHILVGYDVTPKESDENDYASVAAKLYDALSLAINRDELLVGGLDESGDKPIVGPFEEGATVIALRANHYALRFDCVGVSLYDETACDSCLGEYLPAKDMLNKEGENDKACTIVTPGVEPFATGEWLQENLRFPSYPNIRYHAPGYENYPTPGVLYVQYSFAYDSPRPQFGGLSGVGQKVEAVTRHIYYVPESLADEFEKGFTDLGCTIVETMPEVTDPDGNSVSGEASGEGSGEGNQNNS